MTLAFALALLGAFAFIVLFLAKQQEVSAVRSLLDAMRERNAMLKAEIKGLEAALEKPRGAEKVDAGGVGTVRHGIRAGEPQRKMKRKLRQVTSAIEEAAWLGRQSPQAGYDLIASRMAEMCLRAKAAPNLRGMMYVVVAIADALGIAHDQVHDALGAVCDERNERLKEPLS